ncbi:MAG: hypothetical protein WAW07_06610, partial [Bacteroidales bacterium]
WYEQIETGCGHVKILVDVIYYPIPSLLFIIYPLPQPSLSMITPFPSLPPGGTERETSCKAFPPWGKRERWYEQIETGCGHVKILVIIFYPLPQPSPKGDGAGSIVQGFSPLGETGKGVNNNTGSIFLNQGGSRISPFGKHDRDSESIKRNIKKFALH